MGKHREWEMGLWGNTGNGGDELWGMGLQGNTGNGEWKKENGNSGNKPGF